MTQLQTTKLISLVSGKNLLLHHQLVSLFSLWRDNHNIEAIAQYFGELQHQIHGSANRQEFVSELKRILNNSLMTADEADAMVDVVDELENLSSLAYDKEFSIPASLEVPFMWSLTYNMSRTEAYRYVYECFYNKLPAVKSEDIDVPLKKLVYKRQELAKVPEGLEDLQYETLLRDQFHFGHRYLSNGYVKDGMDWATFRDALLDLGTGTSKQRNNIDRMFSAVWTALHMNSPFRVSIDDLTAAVDDDRAKNAHLYAISESMLEDLSTVKQALPAFIAALKDYTKSDKLPEMNPTKPDFDSRLQTALMMVHLMKFLGYSDDRIRSIEYRAKSVSNDLNDLEGEFGKEGFGFLKDFVSKL